GSGTVVLIDRVEHQSQGRLRARVEAADRAEVEQAERALGGDEDVSGVQVGMEGALADDLLERGPEQGGRQAGAFGAAELLEQRPCLRDRLTGQLVHDEEALSAEFRVAV